MFLSMAACLFATPPRNIEAAFDSSGQILKITVDHEVDNIPGHYIMTIAVKVNKNMMINQSFASQTNDKEQNAIYMIIDTKPGDKVTISATCSIYGSKSVTIDAPVK
jgi:MinD superfamily P-loop ATPase